MTAFLIILSAMFLIALCFPKMKVDEDEQQKLKIETPKFEITKPFWDEQ